MAKEDIITDIDYEAVDAETDMPSLREQNIEALREKGFPESYIAGLDAPNITTTKDKRTEEQKLADRQTLKAFALDMTPVIGDVKAATEFPEDMQLAKDLFSEGYSETDFKKMGLGSLYGVATVLGFIPAADLITKPIQKGIKASTRKSSKAPVEFQPEFRQQQIADAKKLFSDSASRRQYLKNVNRPIQKVFHGSKTMGSSIASDVVKQRNQIQNTLDMFEDTYSINPITRAVANNNDSIKLDVSKFDNVLRKENFKFPYVIPRDENFPEPTVTYATPTVTSIEEDFAVIDLEILDPTKSEGAYAKDRVIIPVNNGIVNLDDLQYTINDYSAKSFQNAFADTVGTGTTRADILEAEGFEPYSDFRGAPGLTRDIATGEHFELKEQALSTSRDPFVSLKPGFGNRNLQNVVYADLPPSVQKNMSPEQYLEIQQSYSPRDKNITKTMKLDEDPSLVGVGLPKTHHLESEVAVTKPELLTPTKLDPEKKYVTEITEALRNQKNIGKQDLAGRIATGQKLVNSIIKNEKILKSREIDLLNNPKAANQYYNTVKDTFKDLQSLGMFTEQYGARGTFDNILIEDLSKSVVNFPDTGIDKNLKLAIDALPDGEKRQNLIALRETLISIGRQKNNQDFMSAQTKGLSKKEITKKHFTTNSKDKRVPIDNKYGYRDLKEIIFILSDKLSQGGLIMNEGGMAIEKQMELFEDGGLMQEGGTVDPVSGNDVPVGSTQEEVRDDIPAQLSEGEFVFPADVVRFYGLEKLMEMRQRAKAGLRMMEDMGQMGNSEEATLPDDIPFDLEDLDMEDEPEYNDTMEMQVGGFVQPQGFTGIQTMQPSAFQNYQPQYVPYQAPTVPTTYQPVQQQAVPTFTGQVPQAEEFLKTPQPGEQDLRKYVNDEGQVRMIPFVNDQPVYPIPQGFYPEAEKPVEEQPAPTAVTTETARVTDRGGRDAGDVTPSTTDVTGIGYDRSSLTDSLRGTIDDYGFGFAALGETMMRGSSLNIIGNLFNSDPKVGINNLNSAMLGGVIDNYRGGNVTYSDPSRPGVKTGNYSITTSLDKLDPAQQDFLADVANRTAKELQSIFTDEEGKAKTASAVSAGLEAKADSLGISTTLEGTNISKSRTTLMREIAKAVAAQKEVESQQKQLADIAQAQRTQAPSEAQKQSQPDKSPGGSYGDKGDFKSPGGKSGYSGAAGAGSFEGMSPRAKGGLIEKPKPKKMKRGGLASKK